MALLLAAISLGFLGSFHCIGMCGPIAMALPIHTLPLAKRIILILVYNSGRIVTYSLLGAFFGVIGQSVALFGFQQILSLTLGLLILAGLFISSRKINIKLTNKFYRILSTIKNKIALQFQKKEIKSFFIIGFLNGLLPCGLVYLAIAGALATGSMLNGVIFMSIFGMGTLPFMFAISYTSHLITLQARITIKKFMPIVIGIMAILLVLRGLNLNIKYISPAITEEKTPREVCHKQINCCHKK